MKYFVTIIPFYASGHHDQHIIEELKWKIEGLLYSSDEGAEHVRSLISGITETADNLYSSPKYGKLSTSVGEPRQTGKYGVVAIDVYGRKPIAEVSVHKVLHEEKGGAE